MRETLQLAFGRHPHLLQPIHQTEPLIERIASQRATKASIVFLQERAQNRAAKRSPAAQLELLLLAGAHLLARPRQPSLQGAFHEIPFHATTVQASIDSL